MIKKIALTIVFCFLIISCGKKGDPEYKSSKKNSEMQGIIVNKV